MAAADVDQSTVFNIRDIHLHHGRDIDATVSTDDALTNLLKRGADGKPSWRAAAFLPGETAAFIGRGEELEKLARRIETHNPAGTVVAIHAVDGMAGVGKTTLALHAAHKYRDRYPDGQLFVDLRGYTAGIPPLLPEAALEKLLRQAGMTKDISLPLEERQDLWREMMAERRALIVLDNALDRPQVEPLLPRSAGCLVLITSRSRLIGLPGTNPLRLDPLPQDESIALFCGLVGDGRCADKQAVAEVTKLVGHLPLAIEMIASRMRNDQKMSLDDLTIDLEEARNRMDEVSPGGAGVRTAFQVSLLRLDDAGRRAFRTIGLHPGAAVGVPQFAALAGTPYVDAARGLRSLDDRNLVKSIIDSPGCRYYQMHDLVRELAREEAGRLTAEHRSAAIDRLMVWYDSAIGLLESLWQGVSKAPDERGKQIGLELKTAAEASMWLVSEQENLLALTKIVEGKAAARVCARSAWFYEALGLYATSESLYHHASRLSRHIEDSEGEAYALLRLGVISRYTGGGTAAATYYQQSLASYEHLESWSGVAMALCGLGHVSLTAGDRAAANDYFEQAFDVSLRAGSRGVQTSVLAGLADSALLSGRIWLARRYLIEALDICRELRERHGEVNILNALGNVAHQLKDFDSAVEWYKSATKTCDEIGDRYGKARALWGLGDVLQENGSVSLALDYLRMAVELYERFGDGSMARRVRERIREIE